MTCIGKERRPYIVIVILSLIFVPSLFLEILGNSETATLAVVLFVAFLRTNLNIKCFTFSYEGYHSPKRVRIFIASILPCFAAFRHQSIAASLSFPTPFPLNSIQATFSCAYAFPNLAATMKLVYASENWFLLK